MNRTGEARIGKVNRTGEARIGRDEQDRLIIIMYIYHALVNALSAHMIHIKRNTMFYTHVEHSPTKTVYIRYYMETHTHTHTHLSLIHI